MSVLSSIKGGLSRAFSFFKSLLAKHDKELENMAKALLPIVVNVGGRTDLSGDQKKKVIVDAVLDKAGAAATTISKSLLNEAIEVAANRYNISVGKTTEEKIDNTAAAVVAAGVKLANEKFGLKGDEAENAGVSL